MEIIIAVNNLGYIGLNNKLPWHNKEDLLHFKKLTLGKKCLVGKNTYEGLPKLKDRELIVVGTGYYNLEEALELKPDYCIGGKTLYESVYKLCSKIHLSIINNNTIGDIEMPIFEDYKGELIKYYF